MLADSAVSPLSPARLTLARTVVSEKPHNTVDVLQQAFDRCAASIYRFFMVRTGHDGHLCEDLMQQLWVAMAQNAVRVPRDEMEFWLRGVARNLLNTHWRKKARRPGDTPTGGNGGVGSEIGRELADRIGSEKLPAAMLEKREVRDALLLAITELPASDQELIVAHYFESVPQTVLAERAGVSARAIEGRLYRARQALRDQLAHVVE